MAVDMVKGRTLSLNVSSTPSATRTTSVVYSPLTPLSNAMMMSVPLTLIPSPSTLVSTPSGRAPVRV